MKVEDHVCGKRYGYNVHSLHHTCQFLSLRSWPQRTPSGWGRYLNGMKTRRIAPPQHSANRAGPRHSPLQTVPLYGFDPFAPVGIEGHPEYREPFILIFVVSRHHIRFSRRQGSAPRGPEVDNARTAHAGPTT